jgi:hypothetical protein
MVRSAVARRWPPQRSQAANLDELSHSRKVWLGIKHRERRPCVGRHPDANAQSAACLAGSRGSPLTPTFPALPPWRPPNCSLAPTVSGEQRPPTRCCRKRAPGSGGPGRTHAHHPNYRRIQPNGTGAAPDARSKACVSTSFAVQEAVPRGRKRLYGALSPYLSAGHHLLPVRR